MIMQDEPHVLHIYQDIVGAGIDRYTLLKIAMSDNGTYDLLYNKQVIYHWAL